MNGPYEVSVEVGGVAVALRTGDSAFVRMIRDRYEGFADAGGNPEYRFDIDLLPADQAADDTEDVSVSRGPKGWSIRRGDFRAEWDPAARTGTIRQSCNPYSIDSVLRIVHTLVLAEKGGFLLHAASGVRNGRAFLFSGVSGAGKTTISRLAPADVTLLTDEVSYVRPGSRREHAGEAACATGGQQYYAYGTPFAGELAKVGENTSAPIAALYLLAQGPQNRIDELTPGEATRGLLQNILFFAKDPALVQRVFDAAFRFVAGTPVHRLTFVPDSRVWELIA